MLSIRHLESLGQAHESKVQCEIIDHHLYTREFKPWWLKTEKMSISKFLTIVWDIKNTTINYKIMSCGTLTIVDNGPHGRPLQKEEGLCAHYELLLLSTR